METAAFDYDLPDDRIAQHPIEPRDSARLLVDRGLGAEPEHRIMRDLPGLLQPGDLVVVNDTRVLPARLALLRDSGGAAEVLLLEGVDGDRWMALARPNRKLAPGTVLVSDRTEQYAVEMLDDLGEGRRMVRLLGPNNSTLDRVGQLAAVQAMGEMPLPPYITEPLADAERYQTVYAERPASAAAPTAGLHFTPTLLDNLRRQGMRVATVELVVGLDTFRPIATSTVEAHEMHSESYSIPPATWQAVVDTRNAGGSVIAVGTTALRALESAAARNELEGRTDLFIHGDYPFAVVDRLLTNFHMPRSSLLVLIDSFVGPRWRSLYAAGMARDYRFLSFGDAMLLTRDAAMGDKRE